MLIHPLADLAHWAAHFRDAEIPVFRATAEEIDRMREQEDEISAAEIAEVVSEDPLMSLRVLAFAGQHRSKRVVTDAETVKSSLVLMGVPPFFRQFQSLTTVEDLFASTPGALDALQQLVHRAYRAGRFALGFAVHRVDTDAEVLRDAAMLHDFAEMLLWCHAPLLAVRIRQMQRAEPGLRSATAQRRVLGIELRDLQQVLVAAWRLPELFAVLGDRNRLASHGGATVSLAVDIARHSQHGWDNPALPDDFSSLGLLLKVPPERARAIAMRIDATHDDEHDEQHGGAQHGGAQHGGAQHGEDPPPT